MFHLIEKEIPKRLYSDVVFGKYITLNVNERFVLILTKDLKIYELKFGEIIHGIDLNDSILKGVPLSKAASFQGGPSTSKQASLENNTDGNSHESSLFSLGKYILSKGSLKRIFILLKIHNKLIVLERSTHGYKICHEYENVENFEIIDTEHNFQPLVGIQFNDKPFYIETNFDDNDDNLKCNENMITSNLENNDSYKNLLERIKNARIELSIHKIRTKQDYLEIKNRLMFGPNLIRSNKLEEKQPLGKYGDVWMRVVNEQLVIGIPIVNNCSERKIKLRDFEDET